jgi:Leucine-rich repeat (LRR) protein
MTIRRILPLMLVCALAAGCGGGAVREAAVIGWVVGQGGSVTVEGKTLEIKSLEDLTADATTIQRINLNGKDVTDADLQNLAVLDDLDYLGLHGTQIGDVGVGHIAQIDNLKELELSGTNVTDKGLMQLVALKNLERLHLHNTLITPKAAKEFQTQLPGCQVIR